MLWTKGLTLGMMTGDTDMVHLTEFGNLFLLAEIIYFLESHYYIKCVYTN